MSESGSEGKYPQESEPPVREFADRGTLWLLESPQNLHGLVRLLSEDIADRLDFNRAERLNRSFIPDDLHKQEADLLYRVPFKEGSGEVWVYVLLEHQSRPDKTMGLRLLSYMVQLWEAQVREWGDKKTPPARRKLTPILPIVFYTGKRKWTSPLSLNALIDVPALLQKFMPQFETLFLKLQETEAEKLTGSAIAAALRALQASEEPQNVLAQVLASVVDSLQKLPESSHAEWRRAMQYLYLLIRHRREASEQDELFEVLDEALEALGNEELEGLKMTGAQALIAEGRKKGREEGREVGRAEGREEGRRELLLEQLEFKFGPLSEATEAAVRALTNAQMIQVGKQILAAQTLADLKLP